MEQMNVPESQKVDFDFENPKLDRTTRILQPLVFREGEGFCCLLGPDPQAGVFGCGDSAEGAVQDWETHVNAFLQTADNSDETAQYIRDMLNTKSEDVW